MSDGVSVTPAEPLRQRLIRKLLYGNIDRVAEFSRSECRDKFAVAADPGAKVAAKYDTTMRTADNRILSERTSYVIAPNGTILLSYTDSKPQAHIEKTMAAVRAWNAKRH